MEAEVRSRSHSILVTTILLSHDVEIVSYAGLLWSGAHLCTQFHRSTSLCSKLVLQAIQMHGFANLPNSRAASITLQSERLAVALQMINVCVQMKLM